MAVRNYLQAPYLTTQYLTSDDTKSLGAMWDVKILGSKATPTQWLSVVKDLSATAAQWEAFISVNKPVGAQWETKVVEAPKPIALQWDVRVIALGNLGAQWKSTILDVVKTAPVQWFADIRALEALPTQWQARPLDQPSALGLQWGSKNTDGSKSFAMQWKNTTLIHTCPAPGTGYLAAPYLSGPYLSGSCTSAGGLQWDVLAAVMDPRPVQWGVTVNSQENLGTQWEVLVNDAAALAIQWQTLVIESKSLPAQWETFIVDHPKTRGVQWETRVNTALEFATASDAFGTNYTATIPGIEGDAITVVLDDNGTSPNNVVETGGNTVTVNYTGPLNSGDLATLINSLATLVSANSVNPTNPVSAYSLPFSGGSSTPKTGVQWNATQANRLAVQWRVAIYNINRPRVLARFPSRGVDGLNWTTSSDRGEADLDINNVNTDIVEQVYRSQQGAVTANLDCDTGVSASTFVDTFAILNHNISRSGFITVQGSDDPTFAAVGTEFAVTVTTNNAFYVAPELPTQGYRYWRVRVEDVTNVDGYIQVGAILFGSATIFSEECFVNPIILGRVHYVDKVQTEGFTNVSNDRGVKNYVEMTYKKLAFGGGNYTNLVELFDEIRTNLKALWIPEPRYPSRYGIFGKLSELPEESHTDMGETSDWVDMKLRIDESL